MRSSYNANCKRNSKEIGGLIGPLLLNSLLSVTYGLICAYSSITLFGHIGWLATLALVWAIFCKDIASLMRTPKDKAPDQFNTAEINIPVENPTTANSFVREFIDGEPDWVCRKHGIVFHIPDDIGNPEETAMNKALPIIDDWQTFQDSLVGFIQSESKSKKWNHYENHILHLMPIEVFFIGTQMPAMDAEVILVGGRSDLCWRCEIRNGLPCSLAFDS